MKITPLPGAMKEITFADEGSDEFAFRVSINFFRCSQLFDDAVTHDQNAVCHGQGFALIVRDVYDNGARTAVYVLDFFAHIDFKFGIESTQRFIHKQDGRLADDSPGQGYALALAAGQFPGIAVGQCIESHIMDGLGGSGFFFLCRPVCLFPALQRKFHMFPHSHVWPQGKGLEHHAKVSVFNGNHD